MDCKKVAWDQLNSLFCKYLCCDYHMPGTLLAMGLNTEADSFYVNEGYKFIS